jgi:hypothetical protein
MTAQEFAGFVLALEEIRERLDSNRSTRVVNASNPPTPTPNQQRRTA